MLTKNDLQQTREVVHDEVQRTVPIIVREEVKVQLKPVNRTLIRIQKDMGLIMADYTNAIVPIRKRAERIEDQLNIS